jgi:hypothetical protein
MILRQFLYLDDDKMYSLYSQMSSGLTESIVSHIEEGKSDAEEQKGPVGSGRFLADMAFSRKGQTERRFLHDYAYTQFEDALREARKIVELDSGSPSSALETIAPGSIISVSGSAIFNDIRAISQVLANFNSMGESIAYITTNKERESVRQEAKAAIEREQDRNRKAKLKELSRANTSVQRIAQSSGLQQDPDFLKHLVSMLDYGYAGHFELQILPWSDDREFFTALLKRDCFRENEAVLVKKLARQAQGSFRLLGIVCQRGETPEKPDQAGDDAQSLRAVLQRMIFLLCGIEATFTGRLPREIVVDPIAVYREI